MVFVHSFVGTINVLLYDEVAKHIHALRIA